MADPQHPLLARSMLFVPGDSDKKLASCASADADALILDLEDSVAPGRKPFARERVAEFLQRQPPPPRTVWVRVNALGGEDCAKDLASVVPAHPAGIVLPKPRGAADVVALAGMLDELERRFAIEPGATKVLPIATETAASLFALGGYASCGPRLAALTWGAEDLSVAVGAASNVDEHGEWLPLFQLARSLCLLAAAAAGVGAIDTVYTDFRDERGLLRHTTAARRDGFSGKLAIHPEQVEIINRAFEPDAEEIAHARRVVAAFADEGTGVVAVDGRMLDRPHLARARRTLNVAAALELRRAAVTES
jgi:citrate lyase subunit beta / citryl-CoA lyase